MPAAPRDGMKYPADQSPLYALRTKRKLAELLRLDLAQLRALIRDPRYKRFDLSTGSGKLRHIEAPERRLKAVHKRIDDLLSRIETPGYLFCPVKGRSYVSNAAEHAGATVVATLDVRNYFPSTTRRQVFRFFRGGFHKR